MTTTGLILLLLVIALFWATLKWGTGEHFARLNTSFTLPPKIPAFRKEGPPRRTERVLLRLPIFVSGQDASGNRFDEGTYTATLSGHGAAILSNRPLKPGQEILISRPHERRQANCRVVWEGKGRNQSHIYGVMFKEPTADLWGLCQLLTEANTARPTMDPQLPARPLDAA